MNFLKNNIGYVSMFVAVIGFGSGPPFVKLALQEFYVMDLMAVRFSLAFCLMLIFALIMRADLKIRKIGLTPFLMGLLNPFLVTLSFHVGLLLTSTVNGVDLIIFLGMICVSINEVLGRRFMQTKVDQLGVNTYQYFIGAILSLLVLFVIWPNSSFEFKNYLNFSPPVLAAITLSCITFGAYLFYNFALRRVPVGRISLMYPLTGPIGATMSWLIIDAPISTKVFISLAIILVGTIIPQINKSS
jgi:drug/metabolite transporter (DMT)-like permease